LLNQSKVSFHASFAASATRLVILIIKIVVINFVA